MPQYGNSAGRNKGKKYIKLTGDEIATPEAEQKAKRFLDWFSAMYYSGTARGIRDFNHEVASDTMLQVYNDIAFKGRHIKNYRAYFTRAYHTAKLKRDIEETKRRNTHVDLEVAEVVAAPDFDYEHHEEIIEQINNELLAYVRDNFSAMEISIFEIYVGLQPDVSYAVMGKMLGISANRIYLIVSAIKRDLQQNMSERRIFLLSKL